MFSEEIFKRTINGLFLLALCVPVIAVMRSSQLRPAVRAVVENPSDWDHQRDALRRSTPLWNKAVEGYSALLFELGSTNAKDIGIVGRDKWMFLGDGFDENVSQALGWRAFSQEEIGRWRDVMLEQQRWFARRNIPMLFVVAPAKWSIYPEKLPAWTDGRVKEHGYDQLLQSADGLPLIDLRPALKAGKATADTYSPLNSHWTDYGALVGWKGVASRLEQLGPIFANLYVPSYKGVNAVNYGSEFAGLMSLPAENRWTVPEFDRALPDFQGVGADGKTVQFTGYTHTGLLDLPRQTLTPSARNDVRALVLRDSMGDSLSLYLQAAFHATFQVDHHINTPGLAPNVPALSDSFKPNLLLYVMTERYLDHVPGQDVVDFWRSANAFDSGSDTGGWKVGDPPGGIVRIEGDPSLQQAVSLYWAISDSGSHVVRIDMDAQWSGQLQLQFYAGGQLGIRAAQYAPGSNQLFFTLPADVDGARVTVVRSTGSASAMLKEVHLKKIN